MPTSQKIVDIVYIKEYRLIQKYRIKLGYNRLDLCGRRTEESAKPVQLHI